MFCTRCGQEIPANSSFCTRCGSMVRRTVNQASPNHMHPINPYGRQPCGGYQAHVYQPQKTASALGQVLLVIAGILILLGCIERILIVVASIGYLRYIQVLGYEFIAVYIVKFGCAAASTFGGIRGLVYRDRQDKGKIVALDGIMIIALSVADWICVAVFTKGLIDEFLFTWQNVVFGLIPPILLIVGGYINAKLIDVVKKVKDFFRGKRNEV